jgi:hypothetical protein
MEVFEGVLRSWTVAIDDLGDWYAVFLFTTEALSTLSF